MRKRFFGESGSQRMQRVHLGELPFTSVLRAAGRPGGRVCIGAKVRAGIFVCAQHNTKQNTEQQKYKCRWSESSGRNEKQKRRSGPGQCFPQTDTNTQTAKKCRRKQHPGPHACAPGQTVGWNNERTGSAYNCMRFVAIVHSENSAEPQHKWAGRVR